MEISINLTAEAQHRLDFLASEIGRTKEFFLNKLIESGLDDLEDLYLTYHSPERSRKGKKMPQYFDDY